MTNDAAKFWFVKSVTAAGIAGKWNTPELSVMAYAMLVYAKRTMGDTIN